MFMHGCTSLERGDGKLKCFREMWTVCEANQHSVCLYLDLVFYLFIYLHLLHRWTHIPCEFVWVCECVLPVDIRLLAAVIHLPFLHRLQSFASPQMQSPKYTYKCAHIHTQAYHPSQWDVYFIIFPLFSFFPFIHIITTTTELKPLKTLTLTIQVVLCMNVRRGVWESVDICCQTVCTLHLCVLLLCLWAYTCIKRQH